MSHRRKTLSIEETKEEAARVAKERSARAQALLDLLDKKIAQCTSPCHPFWGSTEHFNLMYGGELRRFKRFFDGGRSWGSPNDSMLDFLEEAVEAFPGKLIAKPASLTG